MAQRPRQEAPDEAARRRGGVRGRLRDEHAARREHPQRVGHEQLGARRGHVLQHEVRVDEVGAGVGQRQARAVSLQVAQARRIGVEALGHLEHGRRGVDSDRLVEAREQRRGDASDAAAEVDGQPAPARRLERVQLGAEGGRLAAARLEERLEIPAAVARPRPRQDGPERILRPEPVPVAPRGRQVIAHAADHDGSRGLPVTQPQSFSTSSRVCSS